MIEKVIWMIFDVKQVEAKDDDQGNRQLVFGWRKGRKGKKGGRGFKNKMSELLCSLWHKHTTAITTRLPMTNHHNFEAAE